MNKKTVFLTGACGGMGFQGLTRMLNDGNSYNTLVLVRDSEKNRKMLEPFMSKSNLEVVWGDLNDYATVYKCVEKSDLILHVAAFVSPAADYNPKKAMQVNYGSTKNLITAIKEQKRENEVKFVYIGTVAETGDRMPPIHWGRVYFVSACIDGATNIENTTTFGYFSIASCRCLVIAGISFVA